MLKVVVALSLLLLAAQPARAQWITEPSKAEIAKAMPPGQQREGLSGRAVLSCGMTPKGELTGCTSVHEYPVSSGFGQAALALAPLYRATPARTKWAAANTPFTVEVEWTDIDKPATWRRMPTAAELRAVWPAQALVNGLGGEAVISCVVTAQGAVTDCFTVRESPVGGHFGDAAVALSPQFLMSPATKGGRPMPSVVAIPVHFRSDGPGSAGAVASYSVLSADILWLASPTVGDVRDAYPTTARGEHAIGWATLDCGFDRSGQLGACYIAGESPKGQGFGNAAKRLSRKFRTDPGLLGGGSITGAHVSLPFVFDPALLTEGPYPRGSAKLVRGPALEDFQSAFAKNKPSSTSGRVVMACSVAAGGMLSACQVEEERPAGVGLGKVALDLLPFFRVAGWSAEGLPTIGQTVRVPVRFQEDGSATAAAQQPRPNAP